MQRRDERRAEHDVERDQEHVLPAAGQRRRIVSGEFRLPRARPHGPDELRDGDEEPHSGPFRPVGDDSGEDGKARRDRDGNHRNGAEGRVGEVHGSGDGQQHRHEERDGQAARGEFLGPLHGFPHAVKDIDAVKGLPFTQGSPIFRDRIAAADSIMVKRLRKAGAADARLAL